MASVYPACVGEGHILQGCFWEGALHLPVGTQGCTDVPMPWPGGRMIAVHCSSFMKTLNVITYFFMSKMYTSTFFFCRQVSLLLQSSSQMFLV